MIQFFGRLMKLPLEAFVYSMEMFVRTMRGIQHIANQGIDVMADWDVQSPVEALSSESVVPEVTHTVPEGASMGRTEATQRTSQEEERHMPDKDLSDDRLKLVRYKILFVKRDYEVVFQEKEELVPDNTTESAYTAWKIAQFIQHLNIEDKDKDVQVPKEWRDYPSAEYIKEVSGKGRMLTGFPEDDKKYLRVYYEVLERYTRERFKYEEEQIDILKDISQTLRAQNQARTSTPPSQNP